MPKESEIEYFKCLKKKMLAKNLYWAYYPSKRSKDPQGEIKTSQINTDSSLFHKKYYRKSFEMWESDTRWQIKSTQTKIIDKGN